MEQLMQFMYLQLLRKMRHALLQNQSNNENKKCSGNFIFKCSKTRYAILTLTRKDKWNRFSIVFPNDVGSVMNSKNPTGVLP